MSHDYPPSRLQELLQLKSKLEAGPSPDMVVAVAAVLLVPANTKREAYSVLREIYLKRYEEFATVLFASNSYESGGKWGDAMLLSLERKDEIEVWLRPPLAPLSPERALKMIEGTKSQLWRDAVLEKVGKRRGRGQPPSKRHLAVQALDIKCADPKITLRDITALLCPCGKSALEHSDKCREQMRQQINGLVKLFRGLGYNFTWDHLTHTGGKYSLIPSSGK
jgi:hypothetical protein